MSASTPLVTIITVSRNAAATIGETLASVAAQDWPAIEHLVIDGASTDQTMAVVEAAARPALSWWSEADGGLYDAMNKGLARAAGSLTLFLNADDRLARTDAVRLAVERWRATGADCVLGGTLFVDAAGRPGRHYRVTRFRRWWLRLGAMPPHPSCFVATAALRAANGFDTRYRLAADFDLLGRLFLVHRISFATLPETLTLFRIGGASTAGGARAKLSREVGASLAALGCRLPYLSARARYFVKVGQLLPSRRQGQAGSSSLRP